MSDNNHYSAYFYQGLKVTVCIPMDYNEVFRDWAIVTSLEDDVIILELSRNTLPPSAHIVPGDMLLLLVGSGGEGFRCNAIFASKEDLATIRLFLTGDVGPIAPREFYRIDVFIPYRYLFSDEQNLDVLIGTWRKRRQTALRQEAERRQEFLERRQNFLLRTATEQFSGGDQSLATAAGEHGEEYSPVEKSWDYVTAYLVNLSGGGVQLVTTDIFHEDELVFFEMLIPVNPPRVVDTVARVVSKRNFTNVSDGGSYFSIALHFVLIDDRDRDAIVQHISHMEALHIRQKGPLPFPDVKSAATRFSYRKIILIALILCALLFLFNYFILSLQIIRNEIADNFGNAVKEFREQPGRKFFQ